MYIYCPGSRNAVKRGRMVPKAGTLLYEGFVCLGAGGALRALMGTPGGRCHRSVPAALPPERAPPISPARKPRAVAAQTRSYFSGEPETAQPPKIGGFVLPILPGKQYSALFTTLPKAPVKIIAAGKPRPEYSAYPPVSTQIDAKNFRQDKSIHILPKHKTDAFRNMQKASAVKNYFNLRQS